MPGKSKLKAESAPKTLQQKTESVNNYIAVVVLVSVIVVAICGILLNSLTRSLITHQKAVSAQEKASRDLDAKLENIPVLIENYNALGDKQKLIENGLPDTEDFPQLVVIMGNMSSTAGIQLKSIAPLNAPITDGSEAPAETTKNNSASHYMFSITVEGTYPRIVSLVKDIEKSARPMQAQSMQLRGTGSNISAEIVVKTFYQGPAEVKDKEETIK